MSRQRGLRQSVRLLVCCLTTSLAGSAFAGNLLKNGDFESGLEGWQTTAPPGGKTEVVAGPRGKCARVSSTDKTGSTYLTQPLDPQRIKGQRVYLQAMVKTDHVVVGAYPYSLAKITLVWNDGHNDHQPEIDFLGTSDWKKVSAVWNVGEDCVSATLYLGLHTTTGAVWFDDVSLAVPELKSRRIIAKGVEECMYDNGPALRIEGREFSEVKPEPQSVSFRPTQAEESRGFVVFQTEEPGAVTPGLAPDRSEVVRAFDLSAAPDQYEPIVFAVYALRPLQQVEVSASKLTGPRGAAIEQNAFDARMGRYVMQRMGYTEPQYRVAPKLLEKNHTAHTSRTTGITSDRPQLYWLTLRVPRDSPAGQYAGHIDIRADGQRVSVPVKLRVLPFHLARCKPWMLYFYNNNPADAELYFRDMREHGMTSVILAQVQAPLRREGDRAVVDYSTSDAFVQAYRKAGFTDPLVYNPFHDRLATRLLEIFGLADRYPKVVDYGENICVFKEQGYPAFLHEVYKQVVRDIYEHAERAKWPPMVFYPVDEPNDPGGWRMTAAKLEYRLTKEAVPSARTFCTVYSIPVMEQLDPWLDVRACQIVHPAISEETKGKFRDYLQRAGGEIWGIDWPAMWDDFWRARELAGFLPAKAGVTGMTAWAYQAAPWTDEYTDLRGEYKQCLLACKDADGKLMPTVTWEGLRAGVTDWRYIISLEEAVAKTRGEKRDRGMRVLREVLAEVPWRSDAIGKWGNRRASQLRARISEALLSLNTAK